MRLDFDGGRASGIGLRSSLHYASTPTLNSSGNSSVDESSSSTGSNSDYWENNSAASSKSGHEDYGYPAAAAGTTRIFIQNPNRNKSTRKRQTRPQRNDAASDSGNLKATSSRLGSESQVSTSSSHVITSSPGKFENEVRVTPSDVCAVDTCLRGHRTKVFVCQSMANLYTCPRASTSTPSTAPSISWSLSFTGIPALILVRLFSTFVILHGALY